MQEIRISVSSLIRTINGEYVGIINTGVLKELNKKVISLIGGGCRLLDKNFFRENFNASRFEGEDSRFIIPESETIRIIDFLYSDLANKYIDFSIDRELKEELTELEIIGQKKPFLEEKDLQKIEFINSNIHISEDKSYKFKDGNTLRFVIYHDIKMSEEIFNKLLDNEEVFLITKEDLIKGFVNNIKINKKQFI